MGGERFTAKGLIVLERNYLEIYPYDRWETNTIPNYEPGTSFTPHSLTMEDGMTQVSRPRHPRHHRCCPRQGAWHAAVTPLSPFPRRLCL